MISVASLLGPFDIFSVSVSYLLLETGALRSRNAGLGISISSPNCNVISGAIGGRVRASSVAQL